MERKDSINIWTEQTFFYLIAKFIV
jgi:hypothetical protein